MIPWEVVELKEYREDKSQVLTLIATHSIGTLIAAHSIG